MVEIKYLTLPLMGIIVELNTEYTQIYSLINKKN